MEKTSRRSFLKQTLTSLAAFQMAGSGPLANQRSETLPRVVVSAGSAQDKTEALLATALEGLGGIERFVKTGMVVAIKPNATWAFPPYTASSTDPDLLRALIGMVAWAGAKQIIVMDHCAIDPGTSECLRVNGIGEVVDKLGVEKVFPDRYLAPREVYTQVTLKNGRSFQKIGVMKAAVEADLRINLAVPKCHVVTRYTQCLKHMMGFLQYPNALHSQLDQGIVDINSASDFQAQLHILEAIRVRLPLGSDWRAGGFETDLSHPKKVARFNQVVAGTDPVLMDAYGCRNYFGISPDEISHLRAAAEAGLGEMNLEKAIDQTAIRFLQVGQPAKPSATPSPTRVPELISDTMKGSLSTPTPLPTVSSPPGIDNPVNGLQPGEAIQETLTVPQIFEKGLLLLSIIIAAIGLIANRILTRK